MKKFIKFLLSFFGLAKKEVIVVTPPKPNPTPSFIVTPTVLIYYSLYGCNDSKAYYTGPIPDGSYQTGNLVQGSSKFYRVTGTHVNPDNLKDTPYVEFTTFHSSGGECPSK